MKFLNSMYRPRREWLFYRLPILLLTGSLLSHPILIAADEIDPSIARGDRLDEIDSSIARGGRLYDKWFSVVNADVPESSHPSYPARGRYKGKNGADWRCKECHGWDYMGRDGAYSKGKHFTGIKGIKAYDGANPNKILMVLQDRNHGYTKDMMQARDLADLAQFVSKGQVDMDRYIDRSTKYAKGDKALGERLFNTICANCHGKNGAMNEEGKLISRNKEPLGRIAKSNPWEALHKILNGQPDENMPALRVFDAQIATDILAHLQTLPDSYVADK